MKAVFCTRYGLPEVLEIRDVPPPKPDSQQILVKIVATAVNSGDVRVRSLDAKGILKIMMRLVLGISKPRKPILGTVYAGVVERVGQRVNRFKIGDNVFGMTGFDFGTHAEYIVVGQKSNVTAMPENATYEEAAALIFGGQTALYYLEKARLAEKVNADVLILGATGAVGVAALQLAKHFQAHVTAVCSSDGENLVKKLGADKIMLCDKEDLRRMDQKFDLIFDAVGKYRKSEWQHLLKPKGLYTGVNIGYAMESIHQLQQIKELFEAGAMKAVIDRTFEIEAIVEAHRYVDAGRKKGNVVIRVCEMAKNE